MNDRITTLNLSGVVKVALQKGTEKVDLQKLLGESTDIYVDGDGFEIRISLVTLEKATICRLGVVLKEVLKG